MRKINLIIVFVAACYCNVNAQQFYADPFAHTFSIVARDSVTGEMGVAVQSHWFNVSIVGWGEAGVGVVATQSMVNPAYGPDGLKMLKEGKSPQEVIDALTAADTGKDLRQVAVLDAKGNSASFTGSRCIQPAGNISGSNYSVQANLMVNDKVWPAMEKAFRTTKGQLAERMVAALEAGQQAGGDIRGKQSAYLLIVKPTATGKLWDDRFDLRVDDNAEPIKELKRLLKIHRAYEHMNAGDVATEKGDMVLAEKEYGLGESLMPDNMEMKFWHAVTLTNNNNLKKALPLFKKVFAAEKNYTKLIPRLRKSELLKCDDATEKKILDAAK